MEPVAAEEPVECALCALGVLRVVADLERGELRRDEGGSVERLLVASARGRLRAITAVVPREPERPASEPRLVTEPAQCLEAGLGQIGAAERGAADDQGVRGAARCRR